jgi:hypothetical protein
VLKINTLFARAKRFRDLQRKMENHFHRRHYRPHFSMKKTRINPLAIPCVSYKVSAHFPHPAG